MYYCYLFDVVHVQHQPYQYKFTCLLPFTIQFISYSVLKVNFNDAVFFFFDMLLLSMLTYIWVSYTTCCGREEVAESLTLFMKHVGKILWYQFTQELNFMFFPGTISTRCFVWLIVNAKGYVRSDAL